MLIDLLSKHLRFSRRIDSARRFGTEIDAEQVIDLNIQWLCRAQDFNASSDDGVARHFDLESGWGNSYPETTGYIIPTFLAQSEHVNAYSLRARARKMLDWLVSIQYPDGPFQGGLIGSSPKMPVTFNTGQILIGLSAGVKYFGAKYLRPARAAADWLVKTQDPDGAWRAYPTPFAVPGEKAYETHVSIGLLDAANALGEMRYADAAKRNLSWAAGKQLKNGFVRDCGLLDPSQPLTHTLGYFLRGMMAGYLFFRDDWLLDTSIRTAAPLADAVEDDGFLSGRLDGKFRPRASWVCVTGSAQIAECFLLLAQETGDNFWLEKADVLLRFVRRTVLSDGSAAIAGAVPGSWPKSGEYCKNQFPNWAAKFSIDAHQLLIEAGATVVGGRRRNADYSDSYVLAATPALP